MFGLSRKTKKKFWHWLGDNAARVQAGLKKGDNSIQQEIATRFEQEFPNLVWEVSCPPKHGWMFCISADGNLERFPDVMAAVRSAPIIPGWTIQAFRPRGPISATLKMGETTLTYDDIWVRVANVGVKADVTMCVRGLNSQNADPLLTAVLVLLDNAIGEYDAVTAIRELSNEPLVESPIASDDFFPMSRLPEYLDRLKKVN
jgi:hypothetical protein